MSASHHQLLCHSQISSTPSWESLPAQGVSELILDLVSVALRVAVSLHNSIIAPQCPFTWMFGGGHGGHSIAGLSTFVTLSSSSLPNVYDNTLSKIHINSLTSTVNKFQPLQSVWYMLNIFTTGAIPALASVLRGLWTEKIQIYIIIFKKNQ